MSDDPENPGGFKPPAPPGAPVATQPLGQPAQGQPSGGLPSGGQPGYGQPSHGQPAPGQPQPAYAQPAPGQASPGFAPPGFAPPAQGPGGFGAPLNAPPGGFGVNLPPGVSTEVYQEQEQATQGGGTNAPALISLIFGVLALVFGWCCGIFSLVFGFVAIGSGIVVLTRGNEVRSGDRTMAIVGISLGALSMLVWVLFLVLGVGMSMFSP